MHPFKDTKGRDWQLEITVAAVKRVRSLTGVDCYKLIDDKLQPLVDLMGDPVRLCDVLFALVQRQAQQQGLTDEDFGAALGGDVLGAAAEAFVQELVDFFPDPRVRKALAGALAKGRTVQGLLLDRAGAELEAVVPEKVAARLREEAEKASNTRV